jgi:hypothetical protein
MFIPVAVVLIAFVVDVANWFEHRRHLQMQVDSAALAAGGNWVFTFKTGGASTCSDSDIENEALKYAGDLSRLPSAFNSQVSNANNVHVLFNSPNFWASAADSSLENTEDGGGPCANSYIDVKATDDKPPLAIASSLFSNFTPSIHAHARVDFFVADELSGARLLPVAVPDPTPRKAYAYFVNESTGAAITDPNTGQPAKVPLYYTGVSQNGVDYWNSVDMSAAPAVYHTATVPLAAGNVGVRIALSGSLTNDTCGQPLVTCYDNTGGNTAPSGTSPLYGIDNVRTFDPTATPTTGSAQAALTVYGAKLTSADCSNPYFPTASCSVRVHIRAAFAAGINPANVTMTAGVDGSGNRAMAAGSSADCPAADPVGSLCWESTADIPISTSGWHTINVVWKDANTGDSLGAAQCKNGGNNPCDDTSTVGAIAQRVFFANSTNAGPLMSVDVMDDSNPPIRAEQPGSTAFHSYAQGGTATLGVQIGIQQAFATTSPASPPVTLRFGSGGQTQAVDCNPSTGPYSTQYGAKYGNALYNSMTQLDGEFQYGCVPTYQVWDGATACPGASGGFYPGNRTQLWASTQPWMCASASTGNVNQAIGNGLNARILGNRNANSCPAMGGTTTDSNGHVTYGTANGHNNWYPRQANGQPVDANWNPSNLPPDDPRIVFIFLVPFGTFNGSGQDTYPVIRFATFYVTGWQSNGGNNNPCQGNGDDTAPPAGVVGHFMTYAVPDISGDSTRHIHCTDPSGIDVCVAKLTQ